MGDITRRRGGSPPPNTETRLEALQAQLDALHAQVDALQAERTRGQGAPLPGGEASPAKRAPSRRQLLQRLGASAAGAAAASTLGLVQSRAAHADFDGTKLGESTTAVGVYASPNGVARPAIDPNARHGVLGVADTGAPTFLPFAGVGGVGNDADGVAGKSNKAIGVAGFTEGSSFGVFGSATGLGHGVGGNTNASPGTVIGGFRAAGVLGTAASKNVGVYGYDSWAGATPTALPSFGTVGQSTSAYGVFGYSGAPGGTVVNSPTGDPPGSVAVAGVLGTSPGNPGVYGISGTSIGVAGQSRNIGVFGAILPGAGAGALAGLFIGNVQIQGHLQVTGGINNAAASVQADSSTPQGVPDPPEPLVAIGQGQFATGRGEVRLDPVFAAALDDARYHVFLTEYDDHHGLYVTRRTREGFEVRAKDSPTASGTFSYRVVARPRNVAPARQPERFEVRGAPIPQPQGVPTLPTVPDLPTPRPGRGQ
jgi:hypothetical protein